MNKRFFYTFINSYRIFFLCFTLFFSVLAYSGQIDYRFKHFGVDDGLSQTSVLSVCQDSKGFMWFGTRYGLNRYDGYDYVGYFHDINDEKTINTNEIIVLIEDRKQNLWIGTSDGVSIYNRAFDNFNRIKYLEDDSLVDFRGYIQDLYEDVTGQIWVVANYLLYKYNAEKNILELFSQNESRSFFRVFQDLDSNYYFMNDSEFVIEAESEEDNIHTFYNIQAINEFDTGTIWFGSDDQINSYNYLLKEFNSYSLREYFPDKTNIVVRDLIQIESGKLWLGTYYGILVFNIETKKIEKLIQHNANDENSLSDNSIYQIYRDTHNSYWIGTYSGGINFLENEHVSFDHYKQTSADANQLNSNIISSIAESKNGELIIGTGRGGINVINRKANSYSHYFRNLNIRELCIASDGNLWVGTFKNGLYLLSPDYKIIKRYSAEETGENHITHNFIYSIFEDSKTRMWVGTYHGVNRIIDLNKNIKRYVLDSINEWNEQVYEIFETQNNEIIVGCWSGVYKYNESADRFDLLLKYNEKTPKELQSYKINAIYEDRNENWWISTFGGLTKYNPSDSSYKHYNQQNGLASNAIFCVIEDDTGDLWISTSRGLNSLNPKTDIIKKYDKSDGLQGNEFRRNACFKCSTGELIFGGGNGFNIFNPENITTNTDKPEIVFTELLLGNSVVKPKDPESPLEKELVVTKKLSLKHSQNNFSVKYTALNYKSPHKNTYAYYLEGFENEWNYVDKQRVAKYTNLPPGNYILRVKAANNDGIWNEEGESLIIEILPAFWQTLVFRMIIITLFIFSILMWIRLRTKKIELQKKRLEYKVEKRTVELQKVNHELKQSQHELEEHNEEIESKNEEILAQKDQIQLQLIELEKHRHNLEELVQERTSELEKEKIKAQRADMLKSSFLANMSHEIRTPLNAILGFSELIGEEDEHEVSKQEMVEIIQSNSNSLLRLIDDILDLSKFESNQMILFKREFNLTHMLEDLKNIFDEENNVKYKKDINLVLSADKNHTPLSITTDDTRLRQVLYNLLSNAFKFTEQGTIEYGYLVKNDKIEFFVRDTGIGIESEARKFIFDRFRKVENQNKLYRGTGLGLSISEKIIEILGGEIWVESQPKKGSVFFFTIPFVKGNAPLTRKARVSGLGDYDWSNHKILIAEDEDTNFNLINLLLRKTGAEIIWAKDGKEAVELYKKTDNISIILLDLKMPNIDGYKAFELIKAINKQTPPVIAQTAHVMSFEQEKIRSVGFDGYVPKPIKKDQLFSVLIKYLN